MQQSLVSTTLKNGKYKTSYNRANDTLTVQIIDPSSTINAGFTRAEAIDLIVRIFGAIGCTNEEFNAQRSRIRKS